MAHYFLIFYAHELSYYELIVMGLCAIGIGMAKTGFGGLGMVVAPVLANIFGAKSINRHFAFIINHGRYIWGSLLPSALGQQTAY